MNAFMMLVNAVMVIGGRCNLAMFGMRSGHGAPFLLVPGIMFATAFRVINGISS